jgi:hypothetical protein
VRRGYESVKTGLRGVEWLVDGNRDVNAAGRYAAIACDLAPVQLGSRLA